MCIRDRTENLPDEEAEDSQANESQKGVHAVLVLKTGGHAVFILSLIHI